MSRPTALCCIAAVLSCAPPEEKKNYSSDIGIDGVPLEQGDLVGTWAVQKEFATVITLPIFGRRNAGANGGRIATVTSDGPDRYHVQMRWCWDEIFEVEGTRNSFTEEALHNLIPQEITFNVIHEGGLIETGQIVDTWGLHNMPNRATDPLPTKDNYQSPPQSDWVLDEDQDGNPGVTVHISGTLEGTGYMVNRTIYAMKGVARTKDDLVGLMPTESLQQNLLETNTNIPGTNNAETDQEPDPDPKNSWFQMVRLAPGSGCDEAIRARDDGRMSRTRPF